MKNVREDLQNIVSGVLKLPGQSGLFAAGEAGFQVLKNRLCTGNVALRRCLHATGLHGNKSAAKLQKPAGENIHAQKRLIRQPRYATLRHF
jgi:hypothetical protein